MMKKILVNGKEITTNYNEQYNYPITNGEKRKTMKMELMEWVLREGDKYRSKETEKEMLDRLVAKGYTHIAFYRTTTCVRGLYDTIAYCKK